MQPRLHTRRQNVAWGSVLVHACITLVCLQSADGIASSSAARSSSHGPLCEFLTSSALGVHDQDREIRSGTLLEPVLRPASPTDSLVLRMRGGARAMKKRSSSARGSSVKRTGSPAKEQVRRKLQPVHNLPPSDWMKKIKNVKQQDVSLKGAAKGRKKPVFHFWTKSKIKIYIKKQMEYRVHVRKQKAAMPIKNFGRGWKTSKWKWLPSEYELKQMAGEKAAEEEVEKQLGGDGGENADDEEGGGGDGGGGGDDEEEEFMFPGMEGDTTEEDDDDKPAPKKEEKKPEPEEEEEEFMLPGMGSDADSEF